jgi:2,3-bisphosphoglycerate-independent phosphoglycerate mutase
MDRDHRWERINVAYEALINGVGEESLISWLVLPHVTQKRNDEFIKPILPTKDGKTLPRMATNDAVIFFNYRIDRPRELTRAITMSDDAFVHHEESFDPYGVKYHKTHITEAPVVTKIFPRPTRPTNLCFVSMTEYEKDLPVEVAFPPEFVEMPLSRVIALAGLRQLKLAESEKERLLPIILTVKEATISGEDIQVRLCSCLISSQNVRGRTNSQMIRTIDSEIYDFILINFPNRYGPHSNLASSVAACLSSILV